MTLWARGSSSLSPSTRSARTMATELLLLFRLLRLPLLLHLILPPITTRHSPLRSSQPFCHNECRWAVQLQQLNFGSDEWYLVGATAFWSQLLVMGTWQLRIYVQSTTFATAASDARHSQRHTHSLPLITPNAAAVGTAAVDAAALEAVLDAASTPSPSSPTPATPPSPSLPSTSPLLLSTSPPSPPARRCVPSRHLGLHWADTDD